MAVFACEPAEPTTPPSEGTDAPAEAAPEPEPEMAEPEPEVEPEPEAAPEPEPEPEVSEVNLPSLSRDGFEARNLHCELETPTRNAERYITAGLVKRDADLDACAPKGAAVEVQWEYVSGNAASVEVSASSGGVANCVSTTMTKVGAGVSARCSAVLLLGDQAAAQAEFDAR
ncbi:hypothetical protein PPSIR1_37844 [Plesiocystis pacifica SIR-1]|uniref:Uncharacterized protein n=1 Tax=Plesiocystis pacifica SIR-1 TaxID=391625 RepID=A6G9K8_9BACT|nr:hypothetical protein [Plesiocystis pacifica]EDM77402.1 hypothetical protein PPSIR1_37844 [Plesiocystis pacifica SIR-1]